MSNTIAENQFLDSMALLFNNPAFEVYVSSLEEAYVKWDSVGHLKATGKSIEYAEGVRAGINLFLGLEKIYRDRIGEHK